MHVSYINLIVFGLFLIIGLIAEIDTLYYCFKPKSESDLLDEKLDNLIKTEKVNGFYKTMLDNKKTYFYVLDLIYMGLLLYFLYNVFGFIHKISFYGLAILTIINVLSIFKNKYHIIIDNILSIICIGYMFYYALMYVMYYNFHI